MKRWLDLSAEEVAVMNAAARAAHKKKVFVMPKIEAERDDNLTARSGGAHEWITGLLKRYPKLATCKKCGIVLRGDGQNGPCKGNVKVKLREKALTETLLEKTISTALYVDIQASWPPSVNHYWERNKNGSMRIGKAGLAYRKEIAAACYGRGKIMGPCGIEITAYPPDRRERDTDNILKALFDALAKAGAIESDKYIDVIHLVRVRDAVVDGGDIRARITPIRYPL